AEGEGFEPPQAGEGGAVFKFQVDRVIPSVWCYLVLFCAKLRVIQSVWCCPVLSSLVCSAFAGKERLL
ncbi:MAG: hypothetical protein KJ625_03295, partial [Actinobacteria bacterium]|nr:hypothetical protein [Actinomycetota bacterium]